jgi:DNA polymerase-3 subunit delta
MPKSIPQSHLQGALKQDGLAPLYLIIGEDDLLRDTAVATLKTAVLGENGDDFNCDIFYGDEASGAEIAACASEIPVFASRRMVVVKGVDKLPAREGDALLPYFEAPNETTTAAFVAPKLDGRLKVSQALARAAVTVECAFPSEAQLVPWIRLDAQRLGIQLKDEAVQLLKESGAASLYGVRRELEKLASYVPPNRAVTAGDVETLRGIEPGASVFDLAIAIGARDRKRVLTILARNLESGEAPLRILGSLAWQYRRIWKVKDLLKGSGRDADAARTLRMDPYKVREFLNQFSEIHLGEALRWFLDVDAKLKGGSGGKPSRILERLVLSLCDRPDSPSPAPLSRQSSWKEPARTRPLSNVRTITNGKRSKS